MWYFNWDYTVQLLALIGVICAVLIAKFLEKKRRKNSHPATWKPIALIGVALAVLLFGLHLNSPSERFGLMTEDHPYLTGAP